MRRRLVIFLWALESGSLQQQPPPDHHVGVIRDDKGTSGPRPWAHSLPLFSISQQMCPFPAQCSVFSIVVTGRGKVNKNGTDGERLRPEMN